MRPIDADKFEKALENSCNTEADSYAFVNFLAYLDEQPTIEINGWIPVGKRLPEENISPITHDYYTYECTFQSDNVTEVRSYKFGDGHWWNGGGCVDQYIKAWRERLEPYTGVD